MTMAAQTRKEPLWWATAQRVDEVGAGMLNITQIAELTGLNSNTIHTAINSEGNTGRRARLRELSRPKWNWCGIPLWDVTQVAAYHSVVAQRWKTREEFADLPTYTETQVLEHQLTSLRGASRRTTVPLTTLHRWKLASTFPDPKALMRVNSPTPRVLYSRSELRMCIKYHHADWLADHPEVDLDAVMIADTTD